LDYRCYEGKWLQLPDFSSLPVLKRGCVTNFDLQVRTRDEGVALVFSGYFGAPQDGEYRFWTASDDGSKLYLDDSPLRASILGAGILPTPQPIFPGQLLAKHPDGLWAGAEGTVSQVKESSQGAALELTAGMGRIWLQVMDGNSDSLGVLLKSRVRVAGIYQTAFTADGQSYPFLLVPDLTQMTILDAASAQWADYPAAPIGSLLKTNSQSAPKTLVYVSGSVCSNSAQQFLIKDATGQIWSIPIRHFPELGAGSGYWHGQPAKTPIQCCKPGGFRPSPGEPRRIGRLCRCSTKRNRSRVSLARKPNVVIPPDFAGWLLPGWGRAAFASRIPPGRFLSELAHAKCPELAVIARLRG
jgi:hypothetical protein